MHCKKWLPIVFAVVFAFSVLPVQAGGGSSNSPFKALHDAGLIEDLNLEQTMGDYTLTLRWVYADENILAADLSLSGIEVPDDFSESTIAHYMPTITLADAGGSQFSMQNMSAELAEVKGEYKLNTTITFYSQAMTPAPEGDNWTIINDYFRTTYGDSLPETVDLRVEASINYVESMEDQKPDVIGPFTYDVTVPLYSAITLEPELSDDTNDLLVTFDTVKITPLETSITFCYDLPSGADWQPEMILTLGDEEAEPSGWGMTKRPTPKETSRCFNASFIAVYDQEPTDLTFTIERLRISEPTESPEFWRQVQAELAKQGIEVEFTLDYGMSYEVLSAPEGMTDEDVWNVMQGVRLSLRDSVEGPWTFTISVPES